MANCDYCGAPLGYAPQGEYCTNDECTYIDGHYDGPRKHKPSLAQGTNVRVAESFGIGKFDGIIKGISTSEMPVMGKTYIVEAVAGSVIPNETYPYTHVAVPECHFELIW